MKKNWIFFILIMSISFNILCAIELILVNDRVISGKFIKINEENVLIFSQEKLVTVSIPTIAVVIDNQKEEISLNDLFSYKKGRINYNSVKEEIEITQVNIDKMSLIFPDNSSFVEVYLLDNTKYFGYLDGYDENNILLYDQDNDNFYLIDHKVIKQILQESEEITDNFLTSISSIDLSSINSYKIISSQIFDKKINTHIKKINKNNVMLTAGCDFGFSHIIKQNEKEYRYDLRPSGYLKLELINKKKQTGVGIGFQMYKEIAYSRGATCSFIPIYFILGKRTKPIGYKVNIGANVFLGNFRYSQDEILLPGFYFATGPTFIINDNFSIEMMYTINNGNIRDIHVFNQSFSIGITFK